AAHHATGLVDEGGARVAGRGDESANLRRRAREGRDHAHADRSRLGGSVRGRAAARARPGDEGDARQWEDRCRPASDVAHLLSLRPPTRRWYQPTAVRSTLI